MEEFLVEVDEDEALFDLIDPAELLGNEAFEVGGVDFGHELQLALLVDAVLHFTAQQVVYFLLAQQVD